MGERTGTADGLVTLFLGLLAVGVRSDLDIPGQIARFLSLYLLFSIGFRLCWIVS